jgi:hypothetical protein
MTIGIIMVMIPVVIPGLSSISSGLSEKFPAIVGEADDKPSSILIKSGMADFGDLNTDPPEIKLDEGQTLIDVITIDTINDKDGDAYKYFPNTENIALVLVLGVMCCYCYVFVCIQVAQRIVGMLLKILLAPYALSGLVDAKDNSTSIWFRMTMSDFIVNFLPDGNDLAVHGGCSCGTFDRVIKRAVLHWCSICDHAQSGRHLTAPWSRCRCL